MASNTINNFFTEGSIFGITYYVRDGRVIARPAHNLVGKGPKSLGVMEVITRWGSIINAWKTLAPFLRSTMTERKRTESAYNKFVSENFPLSSAHLTKDEVRLGGCVLEDFVVSTGAPDKVPTVMVTTQGERHVSDIMVRSLELDENTTVGEFASAVILSNPAFQRDDNLLFLRASQRWNQVTDTPYFTAMGFRLTLDPDDSRKLRAIVGTDGYLLTQATVDERTGKFLSAEVRDGQKVAYIHERKIGGKTYCSRQQLTGPNPMQETYASPEATAKAIRSYGGSKDANFFDPNVQSVTYEDLFGDAALNPVQVTLTCSVVGTGGTVSPASTSVAVGTSVTFTATPDSGKRVKRWSTGATGNTLTVNASSNQALTVEFEDIPGSGGSGGGDWSR